MGKPTERKQWEHVSREKPKKLRTKWEWMGLGAQAVSVVYKDGKFCPKPHSWYHKPRCHRNHRSDCELTSHWLVEPGIFSIKIAYQCQYLKKRAMLSPEVGDTLWSPLSVTNAGVSWSVSYFHLNSAPFFALFHTVKHFKVRVEQTAKASLTVRFS